MSSPFIADASITLAWCFLDEATPSTKRLFEQAADLSILVPDFWQLEIANALYVAERKGRIDLVRSQDFLELLASLEIEYDLQGLPRAFEYLLPLSRTHGLTAYDATYLDLALRTELPLATLDDPLRKAAKKAGVMLLGK
jgi:predicted nucleic acid-binding protein